MKPINKKIPGFLPPPPKTEIDGKITDLSSKSIPELLELRDRQHKLLTNKAFTSKLSDKGAKIKAFYDKIQNTLEAKNAEQRTCEMFNNLKIDVNRDSVQDIEWDRNAKSKTVKLDSDDDSEPEDVMHILSQSTATERITKVLPPPKPLITPEDLVRADELPHVKYIVDKTEHNPAPKPLTGNFKPYKTTKSDVHNPEKEMIRKKGKHWEVTAATPPPIIHGPTKILTIEESLQLQKEYNQHLKEIEVKHAAEKLLAKSGVKMADLPKDTSKFGNYREADSDSEESDPEGSDKEVHDDEPERGGVIFTVMK